MLSILPQLDVKENKTLLLDEVMSEKEVLLERYARFFKANLARFADYTDPNYNAIEVINDEGLIVTQFMDKLPNFNLCHISLIESLIENPMKLKEISLVHAVMPFEDTYRLISALSKVPEVSDSKTRVILGTFDDYGDDHKLNQRILNNMMNSLDFCGYHSADIDGTSLRMVYSNYKKNLRKRH